MNGKCKCGKKLRIIKEGTDDGSKIKVVRRGRGKTKSGEKKKPSIQLVKIINPETRNKPYVIESQCEECERHVIIRGRGKAEARHRFYYPQILDEK